MELRLDIRQRAVSGFDPCFTHLQLAMGRFCYGPQAGISTESLSYTEFQPYEYNERAFAPNEVSIFSIEAQICPNPPDLCLCTQEIARSPGRSESSFSCTANKSSSEALYLSTHIESRRLATSEKG